MSKHKRKLQKARRAEFNGAVSHQPPTGWMPLGALVDHAGPVRHSYETDEDGLPLWEQPAKLRYTTTPHPTLRLPGKEDDE